MTSKTKAQRIRSIYGIVFGLFTVFVGALLIRQVWSIYLSAENKPFSTASIAKHFKQIQVFVWAWILALVVNVGWGIFLPEAQKKEKQVDYAAQLKRLKSRLPDEGKCLLGLGDYEIFRRITWGLCCVLLGAGLLVCAYLLTGQYTPQSSSKFLTENGGVAERMLLILACVIACAFLIIGAVAYDTLVLSSEVTAVKRFIATEAECKKNGKPNAVHEVLAARGQVQEYERVCAEVAARRKKEAAKKNGVEKEKRKAVTVWVLRGVLAGVAVVLIIVGICNGGMTAVLEKAKNICTQCIGLG